MRIKIAILTTFLLFVALFFSNVYFAEDVPQVIDFELEIEMKDDSKYDVEFELFGDRYEAEYQVPNSKTLYGEDAKAMIEPLLHRLELAPDMDQNNIPEQIFSIFTINKTKVDEFKLEVKFSNGQIIKIDQ